MMKRNLLFVLCVLCGVLPSLAQDCELRFNKNGEFKIVQFTDTHYKVDDKANSQIALDRINEALDAVQPDMVVFTGDVVVSNESFTGFDIILEPCIKRNIPYAVVFGNHDDEYDHTRAELYDYIANKEYSLLPLRAGGVLDFVLPVCPSGRNDDKRAALLYFIDSHSYTPLKDVPGYAWIKFEQIAWYRAQSKKFTELNGGQPLPALAFFHIPLPEYQYAVVENKAGMVGLRMEEEACPTGNSGLFLSMKECGDVMGTFVGHDHNNDYAIMYKDILLAYGRYTGGNTVYNDLPNGCRVIVLKENERRFNSYIRLANGKIESQIIYPDSFNK